MSNVVCIVMILTLGAACMVDLEPLPIVAASVVDHENADLGSAASIDGHAAGSCLAVCTSATPIGPSARFTEGRMSLRAGESLGQGRDPASRGIGEGLACTGPERR